MRSHHRFTAISARATSRALTSAIAAVSIALAVTACGQSALNPDPATCKAALQAQYLKTRAGVAHSAAEPATCKNLPPAEVRQFTAQLRNSS